MTGKTAASKGGKNAPSREDRLKKALKANLSRRKAQERARKGTQTETGNTQTGRKEG